MCVCMCVCARERERIDIHDTYNITCMHDYYVNMSVYAHNVSECVCVCVCVCVCTHAPEGDFDNAYK